MFRSCAGLTFVFLAFFGDARAQHIPQNPDYYVARSRGAYTRYLTVENRTRAHWDFLFAGFRYRMRASEDATCTTGINELLMYLNGFYGAAYRGRDGEADFFHQRIQLELSKAISQNVRCYEESASLYAFASYLFLTTGPDTRQAWGPSVFLYLRDRELAKDETPAISPVNSELRMQMGYPWDLPAKHRALPGKILGAYDCLNEKIHFDPSLRPTELGGVIAHEMDHYFRDKLTWYEGTALPSDDPLFGLATDEVLATLAGAYAEMRVFQYANRFDPKARVWRFYGIFPILKIPKVFATTADFLLFDKKGVFAKSAKAVRGAEKNSPPPIFPDLFDHWIRTVNGGNDSLREPLTEITRKIVAGYFPGLPKPEIRSRSDAIVTWFLESESRRLFASETRTSIEGAKKFSPLTKIWTVDPFAPLNLAPAVEDVVKLLKSRKDASSACTLTIRQLESTDSGYVSARYRRKGGTGSRPGGIVFPCIRTDGGI